MSIVRGKRGRRMSRWEPSPGKQQAAKWKAVGKKKAASKKKRKKAKKAAQTPPQEPLVGPVDFLFAKLAKGF